MKRFFLFILITFACLTINAQKYDFIVAQDGSGNFTSIQAAIDASKSFPDSPVTIFIKNGVYHEKVVVPACNTHLRLIGENKDKTILTYGDFFSKINRGRNSTFYTYTLKVEANDFRAENLTVENSAGRVGQAVALHVDGDRCAFVNCRILGNQDTLYLEGETSRDYFYGCYIDGTTDFIFGEATAFFENCELHSKTDSYITAASTPKGNSFGFVFSRCTLTADKEVKNAYLGRPWRDYARVVYLHCRLGKHIASEGWLNWAKTDRDKTAYYAEYDNTGEGASATNRVSWSHQLTAQQAAGYTKEKVLTTVFPVSELDVNWWQFPQQVIQNH